MQKLAQQARRELDAMRRELVIQKAIAKEISGADAARILQVSSRHLRRLKKRYEFYGRFGLEDKRSGPRKKRIDDEMRLRIIDLKEGEYAGFSVRHFYEFGLSRHRIDVSYGTVLSILKCAGAVQPAPRRGQYRRRRARKPMRGMRVHLDASTHHWLGPCRLCQLPDLTGETHAPGRQAPRRHE